MGIINVVKNVKEIHNKYVVLVKVGSFYYCYGRDSYIISYLFKYKINILKDYTYSCSFPQSAINKVMAILENNRINYLILDRRNNYEVVDKNDNKNLNKYDEIYEIGKKEKAKRMKIENRMKYMMLQLVN